MEEDEMLEEVLIRPITGDEKSFNVEILGNEGSGVVMNFKYMTVAATVKKRCNIFIGSEFKKALALMGVAERKRDLFQSRLGSIII